MFKELFSLYKDELSCQEEKEYSKNGSQNGVKTKLPEDRPRAK